MDKTCNNPMFDYLFVAYLCITLLMAQASGLHMHVQHDNNSSATAGHIIDIHAAPTLHEIHTHKVDVPDNQHLDSIDISQDYLVKQTSLLSNLVLFVFFIGIFLCVPRLPCIYSRWRYKPPSIKHYYNLLQPPLRAPPVN